MTFSLNEMPPELTEQDRVMLAEHDHAMRRSFRRKLIGAVLIAALGAGASAASCVGQSFSYRQAKALEAISKQLAEGCKR